MLASTHQKSSPKHEMRRHWRWFLGLLALEAVVAATNIQGSPVFRPLSLALKPLFPVISNVSASPYPELIANYIALTIFLSPLKVWFAMLWLDHNRNQALTIILTTPFSPNRTWFKRWLFLAAFSALMVGLSWYVLFAFGSEYFSSTEGSPTSYSQRRKYLLVVNGGLGMWLSWSVLHLTLFAFAWGAYLITLRDWFKYFFWQRQQ